MNYREIEAIGERVSDEREFLDKIRKELARVIIGQNHLLDRILMTLLCGGHLLMEGLPGLAKTLIVRAIARVIDIDFSRIQFTPDLLPADLIGTEIYNPGKQNFFTRKGPIFTGILLADEINRAPAKVQSALLQAMEERQVTIGEETYSLSPYFTVLATQNPIEQEGTYPLPEAQLDRFFMKTRVTYPSVNEEIEILNNYNSINLETLTPCISPEDLDLKRKFIESIYLDERLAGYIVNLVNETRRPGSNELQRLIEFGASPRASISIMRASKVLAFMKGQSYVAPEDVKEISADVLRHRIILSYEAEAEGLDADHIVKRILETVEVP